MDNSNSLKQIAQNILDTSYKIYSNVSLINSSLFKAASSLGVGLPEIPQIKFAELRERSIVSSVNKKDNQAEKPSMEKRQSLFGIDKRIKQPQESTAEQNTAPLILKETTKAESIHKEKINKIAPELTSKPNYKPGEIEEGKIIVAQPEKQVENKVSIEEKEAKLNRIQSAMPTKVNITNKEDKKNILPIESISPASEMSSQSEMQKKIFETTNFGKTPGKSVGEQADEISNNPLNQLLSLVKEKHSITTSQAAQSLNVSKDLIERWAKILSQNSLIRLKYQIMGDMILEG